MKMSSSLNSQLKTDTKFIGTLFLAIYGWEFTTYSAGGFSWDDQVRTAEWLVAHPGPVILSNQATPRIVQLYKKLGFEIRYLEGPRRISCNGDRAAAREVLATRGLS